MKIPKLLLMPLGTGGEVPERLRGALIVAKRLQAHLRVLHTNFDPESLVPNELVLISAKALKGLHVAFDQHAEEETKRLKELFNNACKELSIPVSADMQQAGPSASWLEVQGLRSGLVAHYGKLADLTVLARPPEGRPTATFEAAVLETGRPVLVIPRSVEAFPLDNAMVAWNCTAESSSSLIHALPLLEYAKNVTVVSTDRCAGCQPEPHQVAEYLAAQGIVATSEVLATGHAYKGEALLDRARELQSDLVVMGAYSKKRLQGSVFGGVTQYMLARADMPLFLCH